MIVASHITKLFRRRGGLLARRRSVRGVDDVSLVIHDGEMFGLVGRSGSGKTTLGMILAGLVTPSSGRLERADGRLPLRAQMIFQDPRESLNPRMPVRKLIAEPLVIAGTPAAQRRHRLRRLLEEAQLDESLLGRHPHELSGGQRQRVAVARAVIARPDLVIADEPTSMLDPTVAADIVALLKRLNRAERITFVLISHDLAQAAGVCDRIGVMDGGRMVEVGPPSAICRSPDTAPARALVAAAETRERSFARR